jgi:hypothetical protein
MAIAWALDSNQRRGSDRVVHGQGGQQVERGSQQHECVAQLVYQERHRGDWRRLECARREQVSGIRCEHFGFGQGKPFIQESDKGTSCLLVLAQLRWSMNPTTSLAGPFWICPRQR